MFVNTSIFSLEIFLELCKWFFQAQVILAPCLYYYDTCLFLCKGNADGLATSVNNKQANVQFEDLSKLIIWEKEQNGTTCGLGTLLSTPL